MPGDDARWGVVEWSHEKPSSKWMSRLINETAATMIPFEIEKRLTFGQALCIDIRDRRGRIITQLLIDGHDLLYVSGYETRDSKVIEGVFRIVSKKQTPN